MNFNPAHIHLLLNHIPIIGLPIAFLMLAWAIFTKNDGMKKFALGFTVVLAVFTVLTQVTGEPAEEQIEKLPFFVEALVEAHEDAAKITTILAVASGLLSLVQLFTGRAVVSKGKALAMLTLALLLAGGVSGACTGLKGGEIRHDEIRTPSITNSGTSNVESAGRPEKAEEGETEEGESDRD